MNREVGTLYSTYVERSIIFIGNLGGNADTFRPSIIWDWKVFLFYLICLKLQYLIQEETGC